MATASASAPFQLPTASEIVTAAIQATTNTHENNHTKSDESCHQLLLQCLRYGTTSTIVNSTSSDTGPTADNNSTTTTTTTTTSLLSHRRGECCRVLLESWNGIVSLDAKKETPTTSSSLFEEFQNLIVDCLWLVSTTIWEESTQTIKKTQTTTTTTTATKENDPFQNPSMQALLFIITSLLLASTSTSTRKSRNKRANKDESSSSSSSSSSLSSSSLSLAQLLQANLYPSILERLEWNFSSSSSRLASSSSKPIEDLTKRLRMYNTQLNYKQQKYNLLQEESEGYAKVLQFLLQLDQQHHPNNNNENIDNENNIDNNDDDESTSNRLLHLIGSFELDPNRVLDLVMDTLEETIHRQHHHHHPQQQQQQQPNLEHPYSSTHVQRLLSIIQTFPMPKIASLISFKLKQTTTTTTTNTTLDTTVAPTNNDNTAAGVDTNTQTKKFLTTVALLVQEEALDLSTLVQFLGPVDGPIETAYTAFWIKEKATILSLTRVSLTGSSNKPNDDPKQLQNAQTLQTLLQPLENNPVLYVLLLLIEYPRNWKNQVKPFLSEKTWSQLCCLFPNAFGSAICNVAQSVVDQWYNEHTHSRPQLQDTTSSPSTGTDDDDDDDDQKLVLSKLIESLWEPLACTVQSGCISHRPDLFCQICRILKTELEKMMMSKNFEQEHFSSYMYDFFSRFLVPSISLFPSNPAITTELWSVLQLLPYPIRYKLYNEWKGLGLGRSGISSLAGGKPLPNVLSEVEAGKAARYVLKRLSKDNIRDMSRQLAKVTHANPLVVYATILDQIESYDNMVEVMVEAQRFVNPLGLDVLAYCILGRLSGSSGAVNRSRLKEDGVNVSQWLQSLETFTGEFFKRRPFVELQGILSYLMKRLMDGHVMELGVLKTLLKVAGGFDFADYSPAESLSENQLYGRAGSLTLKKETMSFGIMEQTNPRAAENIRKVLQTDGRGVSLLILIAQARDRILFDSKRGSSKNIKLAGNLYDSCQVVLAILLEFLTTDSSSIDRGQQQQQLPDESSSMFLKFLPSLQDLHNSFGLDFETAWSLSRAAAKTLSSGESDGSRSSATGRYILTSDICKEFSDCFPEVMLDHVTPRLLEFFQKNASYDIFCPNDIYSSEIERVERELERMRATNTYAAKQDSGRTDTLQIVLDQLKNDMRSQDEHVKDTFKQLEEEKSSFFASEDVSQEGSSLFLIHCVLPRSLLSPDDAMYSAAFVFHLHKVWTPGFSTIHFLDELIALVSGTFFGLTEGEAANLAVLLWQCWKVVSKWRYDEGVFDKEVLGKPGSQVVEMLESGEKTSKSISYNDFTQFYRNWHSALGTALIGCLTSTEYMHIRSGLLILTRLVDVFPTRPQMGARILQALSPLQDENTSRPDIRASANAYGMMLLKARDDGKWVEEDEADAKARAEKDAEAAIERKKRLEQNFQEMERDSNKITEEIGPRDRFDRQRDGKAPRASTKTDSDGGRQPTGRVTGPSGSRLSDTSRQEGREFQRDRMRDDRDYRPPRDEEPREREFRADDRGRGRLDGGDWRRDGNNPPRDDRRWQREVPSGRSTKRSRPSSPESDRETDRANPKRQRLESDVYSSGRGRNDPSPPPRRVRRESPEPPLPRSRQSRR
ncbi:transcription factor/nuclear export subunit protein [Nitzschia inconspicua]|uniref:THO complex subunit 2 n=1 Tax=Nitzschia inconspicua TaxID=303405 RepID=A0A9K3L818_9STRA|nr:transcription factor/nuclear export subunit protein [Nitzschia inconspicua]